MNFHIASFPEYSDGNLRHRLHQKTVSFHPRSSLGAPRPLTRDIFMYPHAHADIGSLTDAG
jgi:hypothetical protein